MPIIKPARKKKHNYKNSTNAQTLNKQIKQTNRQTDKQKTGNQKNSIFQEEICKITGAKPLHSEEIQISSCKKCEKCSVSAQKLF
jgi:hypothetical protein